MRQMSPWGIVQDDLERHVRELASDAYMGRGTIEPGLDKAADYISAEFKKIGLLPLSGNSGYKAPFTMYKGGFEDDISLQLHSASDAMAIDISQWSVFPFSDDGTLEAEVVFS